MRCTGCGKEKGGNLNLPDGGNPVGGPPMDR